jgi:hypothetical protein
MFMNNSSNLLSMIKQAVAGIIVGHDPFSHGLPVVLRETFPVPPLMRVLG